MIGNRVIVRVEGRAATIDGVLHRLDQTGVTIQPYGGMPEQSRPIFIPMARVIEVIDMGRAP